MTVPLSLKSLRDLMDSLPPPQPSTTILVAPASMRFLRELLPLQRGINSILNTQIEVIESSWLPKRTYSLPKRSQYETRAGFKRARNYRRWWNREQERQEFRMMWVVQDGFRRRADQYFTSAQAVPATPSS